MQSAHNPSLPLELFLLIASFADVPTQFRLIQLNHDCCASVTPILYRAAVRQNKIPILHWAAERAFNNVIENALLAGANVNQVWHSKHPKIILDYAANHDVCNKSFINAFGPEKTTPRFYAPIYRSFNDAKQDLQASTSPSSLGTFKGYRDSLRSPYGRGRMHGAYTPLHLAARYEHPETVKLLLQEGADMFLPAWGVCVCNVYTGGALGLSALHLTICGRSSSTPSSLQSAKALIDHRKMMHPTSAMRREGDTYKFDFVAACRSRNLPFVQLLIDGVVDNDELQSLLGSSYVWNSICWSSAPHWDAIEYLCQKLKDLQGPNSIASDILRKLWPRLNVLGGYQSGLRFLRLFNEPAGSWSWNGECLQEHCKSLLECNPQLCDTDIARECFLEIMDILLEGNIPVDLEINPSALDLHLHRSSAEWLHTLFTRSSALISAVQFQLRAPASDCNRSNFAATIVDKLNAKGASLYLPNRIHLSDFCFPWSFNCGMGKALELLSRGATWPSLMPTVQNLLRDFPPPENVLKTKRLYLHSLMDLWASPRDERRRIPLVNLARLLISSGWAVETKDPVNGDNVLTTILYGVLMLTPRGSPPPLEAHEYWEEDLILLLACLQHCGGKIDTANNNGVTPKAIIEGFFCRWPDVGLWVTMTRGKSNKFSAVGRLQLSNIIKIGTNRRGTEIMKFHRPRVVPKDLPGDEGFISELLNDDDIWLPCRCTAGDMCMGQYCVDGHNPSGEQELATSLELTKREGWTWSPRASCQGLAQ